jgi:uncharacterized protein DUF4412
MWITRWAMVAIAGGLLPAGESAAQTGFDGVITFVQQGASGKPTTVVQTSKGKKLRLEGFGADSGAMIIDGDAKVMMMIQPKQRQYMVMTEEDAKQMAAMMGPMQERMKQHMAADSGKLSFSNTGRTETVAGVRCEVWHGTYSGKDKDEEQEGDACVAKGVGFALAQLTFDNPMMQRGQSGWARMQQYRPLVEGGKGILKVVRIKEGRPRTELEATKIDRTVPSDDAFKPPAGYKEIRMADMMMQAHDAMEQRQGPPPQPADSK